MRPTGLFSYNHISKNQELSTSAENPFFKRRRCMNSPSNRNIPLYMSAIKLLHFFQGEVPYICVIKRLLRGANTSTVSGCGTGIT